MDIVICGAGMVGTHAAEVLAGSGHSITVIDAVHERLEFIEDTMDVRTLTGNCANAAVLQEAGGSHSDLILAATTSDEVNLLSASIGKGIGARKTIARVHHGAYFEQHGMDYQNHFGIDRLICPEFSTAQEIARTLRNPGALAAEDFAGGLIQMQELPVSEEAPAVGKKLYEVTLPRGARVTAVTRNKESFIPEANTVLDSGDTIVLVGDREVFQESRKVFHREKPGRQSIVIMGGNSMAVWLCRALRDRDFSIRLFELNRSRAEELADKLSWVTVIQADPTETSVFEEENIADADVFVALVDDDEHNILGCAWAKSRGVKKVVAAVQRPNYLRLLEHIGIDNAFSPRMVAVKSVEELIDDRSLRRLASLAEGIIDVYRVKVGLRSPVAGKPLRDVKLTPNWVITAVQHPGSPVRVPGAEDVLLAGDTVLVVGHHGLEKNLKKIFDTAG